MRLSRYIARPGFVSRNGVPVSARLRSRAAGVQRAPLADVIADVEPDRPAVAKGPIRLDLDRARRSAVHTMVLVLSPLHDGNLSVTIGIGCRKSFLAEEGGDLIILLGGGTKRRQHADIARAEALFAEYRTRKAAAARPGGNR